MLDPGAEAPARDSLAQEAKGQIESGGTLKDENDWGLRKLAYEIDQRTEADYRWFRFEAEPPVLEQLDHNLKIADGVLRFRIFKVDPDAPVMVPPATSAPSAGRDRGAGDSPPPRRQPEARADRAEAPEAESAPPEAESAPPEAEQSAAEAPAEPAPEAPEAEPTAAPAPPAETE